MVLSPYDNQVFLQRVVSSPHRELPTSQASAHTPSRHKMKAHTKRVQPGLACLCFPRNV